MTSNVASAIAGALWGILAFGLAAWFGGAGSFPLVLGSFALSSLIGIVMGFVARPWIHASAGAQAIVSLIDLYISVALYIAAGTASSMLAGRVIATTEFAAALFGLLAGFTYTGMAVAFWPLSFITHCIIWNIAMRETAAAQGSAASR